MDYHMELIYNLKMYKQHHVPMSMITTMHMMRMMMMMMMMIIKL
jgi:hypothetical protein